MNSRVKPQPSKGQKGLVSLEKEVLFGVNNQEEWCIFRSEARMERTGSRQIGKV